MAEPRREYPSQPVVGVGGGVLREDRVLLVRRKREPAAGLWSIPGGVVRLGETLEEACRREVLEETGLEVEPVRPVWAFDLIERDGSGVRFHYVVVDLLCVPVGGSLRPGGDAKEVRWFRLSEVPAAASGPTKRLVELLTEPFTVVVRNRDVARVLIGTPRGHRHIRTVFLLRDGSKIVFQEATMENVARAVVGLEMHPTRRAVSLSLREVPRGERKEEYDRHQLLEDDVPEEEVVEEITRLLAGEEG